MARKRKTAQTDLDAVIAQLARDCDKHVLAVWAADCAARVLHYFEDAYPDDDRPRQALAALHSWTKTGEFRMAVIRKASLGAHAAARAVGAGCAAHAAARAAGQAVATAHAKNHAIAAAIYAATAEQNAAPANPDAAYAERVWQFQHLRDLAAGAQDLPAA